MMDPEDKENVSNIFLTSKFLNTKSNTANTNYYLIIIYSLNLENVDLDELIPQDGQTIYYFISMIRYHSS